MSTKLSKASRCNVLAPAMQIVFIGLSDKNTKRIQSNMIKWIERLDKKHFYGFFSDKTIQIHLRNDCRCFVKSKLPGNGCASPCDMMITLNSDMFDFCADGEIIDTIAHEMLHLFIFSATPRGRDVFGDNCGAFKEYINMMNIPLNGSDFKKIDTKNYRVCKNCGGLLSQRQMVCNYCNGTRTKAYRKP